MINPESAAQYLDFLECVSWDVMILHLQSMKSIQREGQYLLSRLILAEIRTRVVVCENICVYLPWRITAFLFGPRLPMDLRRLTNIYNKKIAKETSKTLKKVSVDPDSIFFCKHLVLCFQLVHEFVVE